MRRILASLAAMALAADLGLAHTRLPPLDLSEAPRKTQVAGTVRSCADLFAITGRSEFEAAPGFCITDRFDDLTGERFFYVVGPYERIGVSCNERKETFLGFRFDSHLSDEYEYRTVTYRVDSRKPVKVAALVKNQKAHFDPDVSSVDALRDIAGGKSLSASILDASGKLQRFTVSLKDYEAHVQIIADECGWSLWPIS